MIFNIANFNITFVSVDAIQIVKNFATNIKLLTDIVKLELNFLFHKSTDLVWLV